MIPVPRSALVVAAPPATITQRNCLEVFGLSRRDYLRLAGTAFPVKEEGQLRVARFADVEAYLTSGATLRPKYQRRRPAPTTPPQNQGVTKELDYTGILRKAGFRPKTRA